MGEFLHTSTMLGITAFITILLTFAFPSEACDSIEVMICTTELSMFGQFTLDNGDPDVEAICGRQHQCGPLADNCEAQVLLCQDASAMEKLTKARRDYADVIKKNCEEATTLPPPVIEQEIVPEYVTYNRCNLNPTRIFEICGGGGTPAETCQKIGEIRQCIRQFPPAPGCSRPEMKSLERELLQTLANIC